MKLLLDNPGRVAEEVIAITDLAASVDWLTVKAWGVQGVTALSLEVDLLSGGETYPVRLVYPELFPDIPAIVEPCDGQKWPTEHQYAGGGALCLEYGPDNWVPSYSGADLLRSAYKLLQSISGPHESISPIPSRHQLTLGQTFRTDSFRYILIDNVETKLAAAAAGAVINLSSGWIYKDETFVAVVGLPKEEAGPQTTVAEEIKDSEKGEYRTWVAGWAIADTELPALGSRPTLHELENHLKPRGLWPLTEAHPKKSCIFLLWSQLKSRCFFILLGDAPSVIEVSRLQFLDADAPRVPVESTDVIAKRVAIVGLGSVGSKVAVSLARCGVTNFVLADDDVLAPHNLVRNQLDWDDVGFHKATMVANAIKKVNPRASVTVHCFRVGGQENPASASGILNSIGRCDLVIDATADTASFSLLSAVVSRNKKILVWGELFAGGFGGLIARSRAGVDAPPAVIKQMLYSYFDTLPEAPFRDEGHYDAFEAEEVLIASDADVGLLSSHLTQLSIDSLRPPQESKFPVSAYLVGFRAGWIFMAPFDTIPLQCPVADIEPEVKPSVADPTLLKDVYDGVLRGLDALSNPSS